MKKIATFMMAALVGTSALAHSLEEKKSIAVYKKGFDADLAKFKEACGSRMTADYDLASEPEHLYEFTNHNYQSGWGYSVCADALETLVTMCHEGGDVKTAITQKIKKVSCRFVKGTTAKVEKAVHDSVSTHVIKVSNGTFSMEFDNEGANQDRQIRSYLMKNL